jgi:Ala-tRNA(Pro) deacylase
MSIDKQGVYELLAGGGIEYRAVEHVAVFTVEDMEALDLPDFGAVAKNLFVRDEKKRNYYLVVVHHDTKIEMKSLSEKLGSSKLSFASENDLNAILALQKGAVTPFGVLNDEDKKVKVFFEKSYEGAIIGVHPNDNTATVWLNTADIAGLIRAHGNSVGYVAIDS